LLARVSIWAFSSIVRRTESDFVRPTLTSMPM
jgi:hypothetical protein